MYCLFSANWRHRFTLRFTLSFFMTEIKMCVIMSKETWYITFYLLCRNPRPETGGTSSRAGELLRGWQHLRRHWGPRGQLQAQHPRPQCGLRYKRSPLSFTYTYRSWFLSGVLFLRRSPIMFVCLFYLHFKQEIPLKSEISFKVATMQKWQHNMQMSNKKQIDNDSNKKITGIPPLCAGWVVTKLPNAFAHSFFNVCSHRLPGGVNLLMVSVNFSGLLWVIPVSWPIHWILICLNQYPKLTRQWCGWCAHKNPSHGDP